MPNIKAVIFDLDGTLYDYRKSDAAASAALGKYVSEHFGTSSVASTAGNCSTVSSEAPIAEAATETAESKDSHRTVSSEPFVAEAVAISTPEGIRTEIKECWDIQNDRIGFICGATHSRLIRCQIICERNGWPVHPHALRMAETYWNAFLDAMIPERGIREFLVALRRTGVDIAVGSNMTSYMQYRKLMQINLFELFDRVTFSEETGLEKPDKKFFEVCARKSLLRYNKEGLHDAGLSTISDISDFMTHCLFIGDTPEMDYFGPIRAGMQSCFYSAGKPAPEGIDPGCVIRDYRGCVEEDGVRIGPHYIPYL
ncbi:MAG: HAD family hydrolase [Lachnospiraceae bacterium]|nr:HAD family hydrolase [Lachnospiraceae bacterium]